MSDVKGLECDLKQIKESGIAISYGETTKTISVATPIFSWEDKVVASISVGGQETNIGEQQIRKIICETKKAGEEISKELGWIKPR
ncbi:IclR family transcriptional regulator domain-containing protein [Neobacillus drentensis]|uniref:IclR family transcriptional regulator domain-containing protein n=1 Tax=Neobacillus drentensis TaxID=220684 RepID=UPI003000E4EA